MSAERTSPGEPPCPKQDRLRALLEDRIEGGVEQEALHDHLGTCDTCRARFDAMAADSRLWGAAAQLGRSGDPAATLGLLAPGLGPSGLPFVEATDQPGRIGRFGPYEVIGVVGRGGMGVVLKAFDPSLHRVVAVKVLAPQLAAGPAARRRFTREARAAASVCHEHVVTIHAVDEHAGWPFLVMQYVGGKSLQDRIDLSGPLEVKEILRIGMQAARGLAAAHDQGLVHRDVKPANILLENGIERVKLTDFGLARAVDDPSLTQAGMVAGTPQYMSPEQARGEAVDGRSDLFSLGGVMYAMATGRPPFRGDSTLSVLRKVCDESPRPVRDSNPDIPAWLEAFIARLMAKDPAGRFESAEQVAAILADRLAAIQQGRPLVAGTFDASDLLDPPVRGGALPVAVPHPLAEVGPEKPAARPGRVRGRHVAIAAGLLLLFALGASESLGVTKLADTLATVLRIKTPEGTLVCEVDDPEIMVQVEGTDVVVRGGGVRELRLKAGTHAVTASRDGRPVTQELVTIERDGRTTLRLGMEDVAHVDRQGPVPEVEKSVGRHPNEVPAEMRQLYEIASIRRREAERLQREAEVEAQVAALDLRKAEQAAASMRNRLGLIQERHRAGVASAAEMNDAGGAVAAAEATLNTAAAKVREVEIRRELAVVMARQGSDEQEALGAALREIQRSGMRVGKVVVQQPDKGRVSPEAKGKLKALLFDLRAARRLESENTLALAEAEVARKRDRVDWSDKMAAQGFLTQSQLEAERAALAAAQVELEKAALRLQQEAQRWEQPEIALRSLLPPDLADLMREEGIGEAIAEPSDGAEPIQHEIAGLRWFTSEFDADDHGAHDRPRLIYVVGQNCANCRTMEATVLAQPEVHDVLQTFERVALYVDHDPAGRDPEDALHRAERNAQRASTLGAVAAPRDFGEGLSGSGPERPSGRNGEPGVLTPQVVVLGIDGRVVASTRAFPIDGDGFLKFLRDARPRAMDAGSIPIPPEPPRPPGVAPAPVEGVPTAPPAPPPAAAGDGVSAGAATALSACCTVG